MEPAAPEAAPEDPQQAPPAEQPQEQAPPEAQSKAEVAQDGAQEEAEPPEESEGLSKQASNEAGALDSASPAGSMVSAGTKKPGHAVKSKTHNSFPIKVKQIFRAEAYAAAQAIKTGIYIGWRCPEYNWDCFRLGDESKCFCGHLLKEHQSYTGTSVRVPCAVEGCKCPAYAFIPSRPEEIGEMWLRKRTDFDASAWRAKCRCKHTHEEHRTWGGHACQAKGCRCQFFESNFLCAACDKKWEAHQTYFETTEMRRKANLPFGDDYFPFAEMPRLRRIVNEVDGSPHRPLKDDLGGPTTS